MAQRILGLSLFIVTVLIVSVAIHLEYAQHLIPCNLCILQRLAFMGCGLAGLLLLVLPGDTWRRRIGSGCLALSSVIGLALASRQIWLQHLPAGQAPACGPGFKYVLENFPLNDALIMLLSGDGNCAAVSWQFAGFSMAEYSAACFVVLLLLSVLTFFQFFCKRNK